MPKPLDQRVLDFQRRNPRMTADQIAEKLRVKKEKVREVLCNNEKAA